MPRPKVTVNLKQINNPVASKGKTYKVVKLTGTTEYDIGQELTENEVRSMINTGWTVNIT